MLRSTAIVMSEAQSCELRIVLELSEDTKFDVSTISDKKISAWEDDNMLGAVFCFQEMNRKSWLCSHPLTLNIILAASLSYRISYHQGKTIALASLMFHHPFVLILVIIFTLQDGNDNAYYLSWRCLCERALYRITHTISV